MYLSLEEEDEVRERVEQPGLCAALLCCLHHSQL
jgi:hypothetical protein